MSLKYDYNHINTPDPNEPSLIYGPLKIFIEQWRYKAYGGDVREAGARSWESISIQLNQFNALVNKLSHGYEDLQNQINEILNGKTVDGEIKQAREDLGGNWHKTLKDRLDAEKLSSAEVGNAVGEVEFPGTIYLKNIDAPDSPITVDVTSITEDDSMPFGITELNASDLLIEPSGKENTDE